MKVKRVVERRGREIGQHLRTWRRMQDLKAEEVAQRAGISRTTMRRVEQGEAGVSFGAVLSVADALGQLDHVAASFDPLSTDLGKLRAQQRLPKRIRR